MEIKTSELTDAALDWAAAKCEYIIKRNKYGTPCFSPNTKRVYETQGLQLIGVNFAPSTDWAQGGPIIEREEISAQHTGDAAKWRAHVWNDKRQDFWPVMYGPTPLIAAMRCYVASKLGREVEIPDELLV